MSFVAESRLHVAVSPEVLFDRLLDHASWRGWMPRSFIPLGSPLGHLRVGDAPKVRIDGALIGTPIRVSVIDRPREIAWCGGVKGLLWATHRFLFEPDGQGATNLCSIETWEGALASSTERIVKPVAERIGREQLEALARSVAR
jgi:hypothetical protein